MDQNRESPGGTGRVDRSVASMKTSSEILIFNVGNVNTVLLRCTA